ncbi:D-arabinono-1,4-lactone oxidase [Flexivirga meconopsidis]|uniref:D-arabinono-1,4-lactone oxidase n=1 Tax=Flexivirga meconopsidis TaxID=2977121 RepID=UPI00223EB19A|nr:D-arabinono-1,4-lactone oxidase [Flexivirga meconopsidis]
MSNWSGTYEYRAAKRLQPASIDELRQAVADAPAVKVAGSGHSFNGVADSENGWQLELSELIASPVVSPDRTTVEVSGAMTYGALVPHLADADLALANLASLPHITVAGSVATGTHGSGARQPGLAEAVDAIELLTADGQLRWYDRTDPVFPALVVSLGALGIVTRLRLRVEPSFEMRQDAFTGLSWGDLTGRLDEVLEAAYSVSVFGRWIGDGPDHLVLKSRLPAAVDRPDVPGAQWTSQTLHPLQASGATPDAVTEQGGRPGVWADRLPHFRLGFTPSAGAEIQSEFFLPRADGAAAIEALLAVGDAVAPALLVAEIRTVAAESQWLSPAFGRDSIAFHFTWRPDAEAVHEAVAVVEQALAPYDPRPHWGKVFVRPGRLTGTYPKLDDFERVRREFDPDGKFLNDFLREHVVG